MDVVTVVGYAAGLCSMLAFIPQFLKIYRTKSAGDISLRGFLLICVATVLWLAYGFMIDSLPMIATNIVVLAIAIGIVALRIKYG
jgi:MtN3 and saliva related transmembrane protein